MDTEALKMDLWSGDVRTLATHHKDNKAFFKLNLKRRESMLIMLGNGEFPAEPEKQYAQIDFTLVSEDAENYIRIYQGELSGVKENLYINVSAEEMVECFVNYKYSGFSLWNEHEFYISPHPTGGTNIVELKVTGNAANKFSDSSIPYGLNCNIK